MSNQLPKTQFTMNQMNMLVVRNRNLIIEYELYDHEDFGDEDHFELIASDESWSQEIPRGKQKSEEGWLQLEFKNVPEGKSYNLYYVPEDEDILPFQVIDEFEYDSLKQPLEFDPLEAEPEEESGPNSDNTNSKDKNESPADESDNTNKSNLEKDAKSLSVKDIQKMLTEQGYELGPIDGINGPNTRAAVKEFQRDHGLVVDGLAGPNTQTALKKAA